FGDIHSEAAVSERGLKVADGEFQFAQQRERHALILPALHFLEYRYCLGQAISGPLTIAEREVRAGCTVQAESFAAAVSDFASQCDGAFRRLTRRSILT